MPATYTDQFFDIDPYAPPSAGTMMTFSTYDLIDNNDDGDVDSANGDSVNGIDVTNSYPGDTVTIFVAGVGNVTYTGITFYLQGGGRVFTPTDGQVLQDGVLVGTSWVSGEGPLDVDDLGPPCFTTGALIACPEGQRKVEDLAVGDLVLTRDKGAQPLVWVGTRSIEATKRFAPVRIVAGAMGNTRDLLVSPQHRMLIEGWRAELYFGEVEVLVAAKSLIGHDGVHRAPRRSVTYYHLMFEGHEIIEAEGIPTESFDPGGRYARGDCQTRDELMALFPELCGAKRAPVSRPVMRAHDAAALFA